jgi:hypothetical protein
MKNHRKLFILSGIILIVVILSFNTKLRTFIQNQWKNLKDIEKKHKVRESIEKLQTEKTKFATPAPAKPIKVIIESEKEPEKISSHKPSKQKVQLHEENGSPFNYGAEELGDYVPLTGQKMVADIAIKGIIAVKGEAPVAILELKNSKKSFFVRKGNVIRLQERGGNESISDVYLQIKEIKENEVEIVQQQRPDKVIIVR